MNRSRIISLCGGLAIFAGAALSAIAGDVSYAFNALSVEPMLYIMPVLAVLVITAVLYLGRHYSFAAFQIALAVVLSVRDRAFERRLEARMDNRPMRLMVAF